MRLSGLGVFGPPADRREALLLLREVVDSGANHIDTAQYYGPEVVNELIREALYPYPADLVMVSKVGARRDHLGGIFADDRTLARSGSLVLRHACQLVADQMRRHGGDYVAGLLVGASAAARASREAQQIDVVWTGPESEVDTGRLTSRVVVELIDQATQSVLLASYATTTEPRIADAVAGAVERGVEVTVLYERSADNPAYRSDTNPFAGFPIRRIIWPLELRPTGASLHPKFIVVGDRTALIGSANLTGRALDDNLECSVLIRGGPQPRAIGKHIWSLVRDGHLLVLPVDATWI
jgi:phosphatidylserine/phosphatidylglycerophosphate/cardiolipin synthase-like enzyme